MRATVCCLRDDVDGLAADWDDLVAHARAAGSELVLLPEMPFHPWLAATRPRDAARWDAAVAAHERWLGRLGELAPATVAGSRPVNRDGRPLNEGFVWTASSGYRPIHAKAYLPDEDGFWEATWYEAAAPSFEPAACGAARAGMLICTELWFGEHARAYGRQGAHLLLCPRATPSLAAGKWLAGGRVAAVTAGAWCLSSDRRGPGPAGLGWSGLAWIAEPDEGRVIATSSPEQPFVTVELDLGHADRAKRTYPRYVPEAGAG